MNCRTARARMTDLFDAEPARSPELRAHLETCPACAKEFEQLAAALAAVVPPAPMRASSGFLETTMKKLDDHITADAAVETRSGRGWFRAPHLAWRLAAVAAAAAILIALPFLAGPGKSGPVKLLAQSAEAMSKLESVHMIGRMRTLPRDNFELIGTQYDFLPIEMWKQFGDTPKWRVEKPGRVVVMDGAGSILFFGGDSAMRGGRNPGFVEWLKPLLDADRVLAAELSAAQAGKSAATITEQMHGAARILVLTSVHKAQGDLTNDWVRNKSILESDHTRVYSFDAATSRLTSLAVLLNSPTGQVPVLEITDIRYNEVFDPKVFTVDLPADVAWIVPPDQMPPSSRPLPTTPRDTAVAFLEGLANRDWERVQSVYGGAVTPKLKEVGGGLEVVSIGEPFKSGLFSGWFVPYEVRMPHGYVKKHNLAVRNDNRQGRFRVDGGF